MSTGYTCVIDDGGATFGQFVWRCARAFGALIHMRDDDLDAEVTDPKNGNYYAEQVEKEKARLTEVRGLDLNQAAAIRDAEYKARMQSWKESEIKRKAVDAEYNRLRESVMAWTPPSPDHEGLKKFMLEQLTEGRRYSGPYPQPIKSNVEEWLELQIKAAENSLKYYSEEAERESKRNRERSEWVRLLKASVPYESQPKR